MFVDSAKISVKAGKGGDGIVSFRREKYVSRGGPDGGKGGRGGDIIFVGESGLTTLLDFRYRRIIKAENGQNAMGRDMYGKDAEDIYVKVPIGTVVYDADTGKVLADITKPNEEKIIAKGGRGGRGNSFFANSRHPAPDFCEKGFPGEEYNLQLELKVLADVGLVGFPSVGKSTLISVVSAAKPKIASYHFTTLHPNLGVVGVPDGRSFIMADLPGLIEGAHLGAGLGIEFLKHIERTKVIVHIIDMSGQEGRDPYEDYLKIRHELGEFNESLLKRPEIIVANKMDLESSKENFVEFKNHFNDQEIIAISAVTKDNLNQLLYKIADTLEQVGDQMLFDNKLEEVVEYNYKKAEAPFTITKDDDGVYNVSGPVVKLLFERTDFTKDTSIRIFSKKLRELGVDDELRKLGVKDGETVRILDYEFEFID